MGRRGVIHAVYDTAREAVRALDRLHQAGFGESQVEVRSSVPIHEHHPLPGVKVHSRVPLAAIAGGLVGGLGAFLVASLSAQAYPLATGGMAIVALPPVSIITYEGTALGAILATVAAVLLEARLLRRSRRGASPWDGQVAEGRVLILVDVEGVERRHAAQGALAEALLLREE